MMTYLVYALSILSVSMSSPALSSGPGTAPPHGASSPHFGEAMTSPNTPPPTTVLKTDRKTGGTVEVTTNRKTNGVTLKRVVGRNFAREVKGYAAGLKLSPQDLMKLERRRQEEEQRKQVVAAEIRDRRQAVVFDKPPLRESTDGLNPPGSKDDPSK